MISPVSLLVNLRSRHTFIRITDLHLYHLVAAVAPVAGVQMLENSLNCRALVKVSDQAAADSVIARLDGAHTELGSVRVSRADADFVASAANLGRPSKLKAEKENVRQFKLKSMGLKEGPGDSKDRKTSLSIFGSTKQARDSLQTQDSRNVIFGVGNSRHIGDTNAKAVRQLEENPCNTSLAIKTQLPVQNSKVSSDLSELPIRHTVHVTHDDSVQLSEKRVLKAFRRFGRVLNLSFDPHVSVWALDYNSAKEVSKVLKVLANNKLFGYKLAETQQHHLLFSGLASPINVSPRNGTSSEDTSAGRKGDVLTVARRSSVRFETRCSALSLESLCVDVARVHVPVQISLGYDSIRRSHFCIADFKSVHEAAEVLVSVGQAHRSVSCKFAD